MKIIIIGSAYPLRGGLSAYNERLARALMEEGHDVQVITFTLQYPSFLFPGKTQYVDGPAPEGLSISPRVNSINPFNWIKTGNFIRKQHPDLVIIKYWMPFMAPCFGTILRRIKKNKHTRVISIIDNMIPHEKRLGDTLLTRYFVKPVDAFIAQSREVLGHIELFSSRLKAYNPHPIFDNFGDSIGKNQAKALIDVKPDYSYILFFGFIREYKGLDLLLKAFADERFRKMNLKLIVAGEFYQNSEKYMQLIDDLQLNEHVVLRTDFIPNELVARYFCASDIVVQPYKSATQSGVTQIGYHFDKPMLVTNVGGLPEIIPHGKIGYVVNVDEKEIADALVDFFQNNRQEVFEKNIREEKKKYSWNQMTKTIFDLFYKID